MSEPEIARRCSACGVSVRHRASFCPQCGNPIAGAAPDIHDTIAEPAPAPVVAPVVAPTEPLRHEGEGVRGRVEKLRKVSSVVIDQAAYDPSLRFLLVAAVLFVMFIVLLILSKVLG
ncbi:MAG TPA: zinc-ribbon domain-containing protein [Pyrinomonadaceae bacterium]|nr:zinc-ribbon domain-containing protein [Pyrinomonadaceae bacterium]